MIEQGGRPSAGIRESEALYHILVESAKDYAIFMLDPEGRILTWNEGAHRLKGWTEDEAVGQHFRMLYLDEDREQGRPERNLREALRLGRFEEEHRRLRKDGSVFEASVILRPAHDGDELIGFAKVVRDVTDRKHTERRLNELNVALDRRVRERTSELEAANQEMQGFTYSVSHDLRGPLRGIVANSRLLVEDHGEQLKPEARDLLVRLEVSALRMATLVDDLLQYSRLNRGEIRRQEIDVTELADEVVGLLLSREQGCEPATFRVQPGIRARGDRGLLATVLRNLMENACKYSTRGAGTEVEVGQRATGVFFVRDNGIGFDPRYAEKIFQPFERLHNADEYSGTGIGLANVRRIIERHGGRVWAESDGPGKGSTFYFTLTGEGQF